MNESEQQTLAVRAIKIWKHSPAIRAEFGSLGVFHAYFAAISQGHVRCRDEAFLTQIEKIETEIKAQEKTQEKKVNPGAQKGHKAKVDPKLSLEVSRMICRRSERRLEDQAKYGQWIW